MFPPFNQELAHHYCEKIIADIQSGKLELKQITSISQERIDQGLMIGSAVCWDAKANTRVILAAVSGISRQIVGQSDKNTIIVPPLVSNEVITAALQKNDRQIHALTDKINSLAKTQPQEKSQLLSERKKLTDESLLKVFTQYSFTRFDGKKVSLNQIIKEHQGKLPPTGTGDCCAPKLLSYAFEHKLQIISMDEVYFGKNTAHKTNGQSYPPCDERCAYILPSILGLEIIYRDKDIIVINKPSGLLSVPGKGKEKQDCISSRIKALFPACIEQPSVHRLDMETSGLMVYAFTDEAHKNLNRQFEEGKVHKEYEALLDGVLALAKGKLAPHKGEDQGIMKLPFRLDIDNRPHQIYDEENGKIGITEWINKGSEYYTNPLTKKRKKVTRVLFIPHTGRTHQLRLASSDNHGFGLPITGDSLYGKPQEGERLMLHAYKLSFYHPTSGKLMTFEKKSGF